MNKRKFIPLLIFFVLLAFVLLVGGTMPYFLFYILLLTYLIPFIHCLINYLFLEGKIDIPQGSLYTGDSIIVKYKIVNNSIFPITYLEIENDFSKTYWERLPENHFIYGEKKNPIKIQKL